MPGGYSTVVAATSITAAKHNEFVRDQVVSQFATAAARNSAITSPVEGMICYNRGDDVVQVYNGSAWVTITPVGALVATAETQAQNVAFAALATAGPAVTVETGTKAVIVVGAVVSAISTACISRMGFVVSGATTLAAANARAAVSVTSSGVGWPESTEKTIYYTSLTAGSNVFTARYMTENTGTGVTWSDRTIMVIGIP